jgi:hypothetical protein
MVLISTQYGIFFGDLVVLGSITDVETICSFILLQLHLVSWLYVQILSADEQGVDVHTEVLARVCQRQELKELGVIQEEESAEDEALLLQEFMHFLLQDLEVGGHFFEDLDSRLNHQIVNGFWILVARPHDSLELESRVDELFGGLSKDVGEYCAVVNDVQVDPVSLGINPYL